MRRLVLYLSSVLISISTPAGAAADDPSTPTQQEADLSAYHSANGLANRGLFELAIPEYEKFLASYGEHEKAAMARYGLSVCLYRLKRFDKAIAQLDKLVGQSDFAMAIEVVCMRGQCRLALRRFDGAVEDFAHVVAEAEDHALADDAAAGKIEALYALRRYDDAIKTARRFAARWPRSPLRERTSYFWALSAVGSEDYDDAIQRFEEFLRTWPESGFAEQSALVLAQCYQHERLIDKASRLYHALVKQGTDASVMDALFGLGTMALSQGDPSAAAGWFDELIEKGGDGPRARTALFHRGRASFDLARYDEALGLFERYTAAGAEDSLKDDVAYWAAKCRLRMGRHGEAAKQLAEAIESFPTSELEPELHYDYAIALIRSDQTEAGIAALTSFIEEFDEHPMVPDALHLLAATEHRRGDYAASRRHTREFLKRFPKHDLAAQVVFLSAENELLDGNYAAAASAYRKYLASGPEENARDKAYYRLGHALWLSGDVDEATKVLGMIRSRISSDEQFRYGRYILGDMACARGEWKTARSELSAYLKDNENATSADDALLKLGLSLQRLEKADEALAVFDRLIAKFPKSPHHLQALFERGQALLALNRSSDAEEAFRLVLDLGGDSRFKPHALNHLANLAIKRGDFEGAASLFAQVEGRGGDKSANTDTRYNRARALFAAGKLDEAARAFESLLEGYPSLTGAEPAAVQLGMVYARQEKCEKALPYLDLADKHAAKLDERLRASAVYDKAWCLRKLDRVEDASSTYRSLIAGGFQQETQLHAAVDLALIEVEASRFESAAELLARVRKVREEGSLPVPERVAELGTYYLGLCKFELQAYPTATELFEEFLARFGESELAPSASFYCGESYYNLGKHEKAIEHLARVVEQNKDDAAYGPSLLRLGECLAAAQRWPRSEKVLKVYLAEFGDSPNWYQAQFGIGWAAENQGRHDDAIAAYKPVVERHKGPTAARAQFQIGECLFAKKDYEAAVTELLKVDILYAYPQWSAAALFEAGKCFEKLQKQVEARAQFKAVTEKYSDTRWARMAAQRLNDLSASVLPGR